MKIMLEMNLDIEKFHRLDEELPKIDVSYFEDIIKNKVNQERTMHSFPVSFWSTLKLNKIYWRD